VPGSGMLISELAVHALSIAEQSLWLTSDAGNLLEATCTHVIVQLTKKSDNYIYDTTLERSKKHAGANEHLHKALAFCKVCLLVAYGGHLYDRHFGHTFTHFSNTSARDGLCSVEATYQGPRKVEHWVLLQRITATWHRAIGILSEPC
jgi:hypothetical protein